jgi:hypothetical protein
MDEGDKKTKVHGSFRSEEARIDSENGNEN